MHNWPRRSRWQLASGSTNVPKSWLVSDIKLLARDEWPMLRDIRLNALQDSPESFLSTYEREILYGEEQWRAEFARGEWNIGLLGTQPVSLLGATREDNMMLDQCYLEYMWVAPKCRRSGLALRMLAVVLDRLRARGVRTVYLWVLDGNEPAARLYKSAGFVSTSLRQPLPADPGRSEEQMHLSLA